MQLRRLEKERAMRNSSIALLGQTGLEVQLYHVVINTHRNNTINTAAHELENASGLASSQK
jgi:hypothetical protein